MKQLVYLFLTFLLLGCMTEKPSETETIPLLIGTYTNGTSEGIYSAAFNPKNGEVSSIKLVASTENPSFLTTTEDGKMVYAVNENDPGRMSAYSWNEDGTLKLESTVPTQGIHPCHISINEALGLLSVANYSSGNISMFSIENKQKPILIASRQHEGNGPDAERQEGPHAHFSQFLKDNRALYAVDLGIDEIKHYAIEGNNAISEGTTAIKMSPGNGPRHLAFHPTKNWVFVLNELGGTVASLAIRTDGSLELKDEKGLLPTGYNDYNKAADIHLSPDGKYLYASNRGHNSIAIYKIEESGAMTSIGHEQRGISTPRNFTLSPDGKYLLVANQDTNNVIVFEIEEGGLLNPIGDGITVGSPVCLRFY